MSRAGVVAAAVLLVVSLRPAWGQGGGDLADMAARARAAMEEKRFTDAAAIYADIVKGAPDHAGLRLNLGLALHSAGDLERAVTEFARAVELDASLTPGWLMLGLTHLRLGHPDRAVGPLQRVVASEPRHPVARLELADALLQLGRFADAATHFEALVAIDPQSAPGWLGLGRSHAATARAAFERLEQVAPGSAYWAALLARSRAAQQQYRSAFRLYRQALAADSGLRGVHTAIAEIYRRTGRPEWAVIEAGREEKLSPPDCARDPLECDYLAGRYVEILERTTSAGSPDALYWRSLAASELAISAFARLDALPPSPEVHALRAESFAIRGLHDLAIKEWQQAMTRAPGDRRFERGFALEHWRNQDYATARPLLETALRHEPESVALHHALGDTLLQLQMPERAIPHLQEALRRDPAHVAARIALARAHARLGSWADAVPHLEATLDADEDGGLHVLLARAYAASGRQREAERLLQRSRELGEAARRRRTEANDQLAITPP